MAFCDAQKMIEKDSKMVRISRLGMRAKKTINTSPAQVAEACGRKAAEAKCWTRFWATRSGSKANDLPFFLTLIHS